MAMGRRNGPQKQEPRTETNRWKRLPGHLSYTGDDPYTTL